MTFLLLVPALVMCYYIIPSQHKQANISSEFITNLRIYCGYQSPKSQFKDINWRSSGSPSFALVPCLHISVSICWRRVQVQPKTTEEKITIYLSLRRANLNARALLQRRLLLGIAPMRVSIFNQKLKWPTTRRCRRSLLSSSHV